MAEAQNYEDILNQSWDTIPETQALPVGSWRLKGRNAKFMPAKGDASARVMFVYAAQQPMDDVDASELEKLGDDYDFAANKIFHNIWIEDSSSWETVRKFLNKHGVAVDAKKSISDSLKDFKGKEVIAYLDQRSYVDNAGEQKTENPASQFVAVED